MKIYKNVTELLNEICLDRRINDGIFDMFNNQHMDVLREKLVEMGLPENEVVEISNAVIEGKYPERQAFNANGILVTFPNAEYKQRAIRRGTHFEEDPTKGQSNLDYDASTPEQPTQEPTSNEKPIEVEPGVSQQPTQQNPQTNQATTVQQPQATDDLKTRSPEQKIKDAEEVEKVLTTEFTLEEAAQHNWIKGKDNSWYNSDGVLVGYEWYCVNSKSKKILSTR